MVKTKQMNYLSLLYASFMHPDRKVAEVYEDFALIEYKHMIWAMNDMVANGIEFDMDIDDLRDLKVTSTKELREKIIEKLENSIKCENSEGIKEATLKRFKSDEDYFLSVLKRMNDDEKITAFDEHKTLKEIEITPAQADAFNFFLMGETFKEYELITIYSYLKAHINDNVEAVNCFADLASDSIYHLKRFAKYAVELGTLNFVRSIDKEKYKDISIIKFLKENIEEEQDAEKECLVLAEKIGNEDLSNFLLFISRQEVYHAELLERALSHLKK
ncbi:MAG: 4-hydroxythreonine-4-phosphate dehydrogenase [Nautilia sp.]|nr:MAG: 4-hydroxythreonine-4-phosphate dehydrogenase [Nautilia sp.]